MAQVIEIMTKSGAEMMLRGKLGNQIFQVRNGKQIVMQMPRKRTSPPSEAELARRTQFAEVQAELAGLTSEQWEMFRKAWKTAGYKHNGKKYCTLRGYAFAFCNRCAKVDTALLNRQATDASALPTGCTPLAPIGDPN